jgi:hypothetical protein
VEISFIKKYWLWFTIGGLFLIGVIVIFLLYRDNTDYSNPNKDKSGQIGSTLPPVSGNGGAGMGMGTPPVGSVKPSEPPVVYTFTDEAGVLSEFVDESTSAELVVGDKEGGSKSYTFTTSSVLFDAKKKRIVQPSLLSKGSPMRVLSYGDVTKGSTVVALMVNAPGNLDYMEVSSFKDGVLSGGFAGKTTSLTVPDTVVVRNAYTGVIEDKTKITSGNKAFYFKSDKATGELISLFVY